MVVGVDVSSKRIDLAYLDAEGKPQRWHQELDPKAHLIDRLRSIRIIWPGDYLNEGTDVTDIAIEYPYARRRNAIAALMATVGVVTKQAPRWARVAWPSSGELRAAIGARNQKADAHDCIHWEVCGLDDDAMQHTCVLGGWDEHELDALVAAVGWAAILQAQDDAA